METIGADKAGEVTEIKHNYVTYNGKNGISATIIADSISSWGKRIITYVIIYPRILHGEIMTHRQFSRNCESSRAVPAKKNLENIQNEPFIPVFWGRNQAGMQANTENDELVIIDGKEYDKTTAWDMAKESSIKFMTAFSDANYHKQITNRLVEPFKMIKTVVTATEYDNFFWLRNHSAAQPEFQELARCMLEARKLSTPVERTFLTESNNINLLPESIKSMIPLEKIKLELLKLEKHSYHLPYVSDEERSQHDIEDCIKIAVARCAAVSYRNEDYPLEKCREIYNRLISDDRKHSSAMEHVAQVMKQESAKSIKDMKDAFFTIFGVTHVDKKLKLWSGNFQGWIQHRKLIEDECCTKYNYES